MVVNKGNVGALEDVDEVTPGGGGSGRPSSSTWSQARGVDGGLNRQVHDIIDALDGLNRVSDPGVSKDNLGRALDTLPDAVSRAPGPGPHRRRVRRAQRLTMVIVTLAETKVDFGEGLKDLYSIVQGPQRRPKGFRHLAAAVADVPIPNFGIKLAVRGDYLLCSPSTSLRQLVRRSSSQRRDPDMAHMDEILSPPDFLIGRTG